MRRMPLAGRCRCAGGRPPSAGPAATVDAAIGFEYCMRILNEQQVGVPIRRETESDLYVLAPTNRTRRGTDGTVNTIREATRILRYLPAYLKRHRAARVILAHTWRLHRSPGRAARRTGGARRAVVRVESASDSECVPGGVAGLYGRKRCKSVEPVPTREHAGDATRDSRTIYDDVRR